MTQAESSEQIFSVVIDSPDKSNEPSQRATNKPNAIHSKSLSEMTEIQMHLLQAF